MLFLPFKREPPAVIGFFFFNYYVMRNLNTSHTMFISATKWWYQQTIFYKWFTSYTNTTSKTYMGFTIRETKSRMTISLKFFKYIVEFFFTLFNVDSVFSHRNTPMMLNIIYRNTNANKPTINNLR